MKLIEKIVTFVLVCLALIGAVALSLVINFRNHEWKAILDSDGHVIDLYRIEIEHAQ